MQRKTLVGRSPVVQHAALVTANVCLGLLRSALAATLGSPVLQHLISSIDSGMGNGAADADAQFQENGTASNSGASASRGQGSARKRRSRRASAVDSGSAAAESLASSSRSETALWLASSKLLRRIIECCGTELQDSERLELDRAVVGWLVKYGLGGPDGLGYVPAMTIPTLRLELYATLAASLECPVGTAGLKNDDQGRMKGGSRSMQPATKVADHTEGAAGTGRLLPHLHPVARQLFLAGSCNDPAPAVRTVCADGLRLCSNLAQPRARPLYFPPPGSQLAEPVVSASDEEERSSTEGSSHAAQASMALPAAPMSTVASTMMQPQILRREPATAALAAPEMKTTVRPEHVQPVSLAGRNPDLGATSSTAPESTGGQAVTQQPLQTGGGSLHDEDRTAMYDTNDSSTNQPNKRPRVHEPAPATERNLQVSAAAAAATAAATAAAGQPATTSTVLGADSSAHKQPTVGDHDAEDGGPSFQIVDMPPDSGEDSGSDSESD